MAWSSLAHSALSGIIETIISGHEAAPAGFVFLIHPIAFSVDVSVVVEGLGAVPYTHMQYNRWVDFGNLIKSVGGKQVQNVEKSQVSYQFLT